MCRMFEIDGLHVECVRNLEIVWNWTRIHGMCMESEWRTCGMHKNCEMCKTK